MHTKEWTSNVGLIPNNGLLKTAMNWAVALGQDSMSADLRLGVRVRRAAFCEGKIFRIVENKKKMRGQKKFVICRFRRTKH
jgi:hypothetical protein